MITQFINYSVVSSHIVILTANIMINMTNVNLNHELKYYTGLDTKLMSWYTNNIDLAEYGSIFFFTSFAIQFSP